MSTGSPSVGDRVRVQVVSQVPFGVFVETSSGAPGFVTNGHWTVGQWIEVVVTRIDVPGTGFIAVSPLT